MGDRGVILVVDDTPANLKLMCATLASEGYRVRPADSGELALASAAVSLPDLVLLDIRMPVMDGFEVCRRLKARPESRDIPVMFISAATEVEERVKGLELGAVDFVAKPIQREELLARVKTHLELARLRDGLREQSEALRLANEKLQAEVAEHQRAEEALRTSRQMLETVVANFPGVVSWKDVNLVYRGCNAAFAAEAGLSDPAEIVGKTDFDLPWAHSEASAHRQGDRDVLASGVAKVGILEPRRHADGDVRWLETNRVPLLDATDVVVGVLVTSYDVTDRIKLDEQVRQTQKMEVIGDLAGGVAHDFNNLLQAMVSLTELARANLGAPDRMASNLTELLAHIKRGSQMTRQLLVFSSREAMQRVALDLSVVVASCVREQQRLAPSNIVFAVDTDDAPLMILADKGQIEQVLANLVLNAVDAMPMGGRLSVGTARAEDGNAVLTVADTGIGIAASELEKIFEPFYTTKAAGRGNGLGLAVVRDIVAREGGRVEIESTPNVGTTVTVRLPAVAPPGPPPAEAAHSAERPNHGRGERVLVVEDEEAAREGLREMLGLLGYEVVAVDSGERAAQVPPEPRFDVLLTDFMLPGITGAAIAAQLMARWPGIAVVLMSGYTHDVATRQEIGAGQIRFLQKPFDMSTLAEAMQMALAEARTGTPPQ